MHKGNNRRLPALLLVGLLALGLAACGQAPQTSPSSAPPQAQSTNSSTPNTQEERYVMVEMKIKDFGTIKLELDREAAPITVQNFVDLVEEGFYDGLTFHRIFPGFMIQGGCPNGTGSGGPGHQIKGEFAENGWENPISHTRGVISMARSGDPDSAGSQFFIMHEDSDFLDGKYAAFGKVVEGMEVVDALTEVEKTYSPTDRADTTPVDPPVIESVRIIEA